MMDDITIKVNNFLKETPLAINTRKIENFTKTSKI